MKKWGFWYGIMKKMKRWIARIQQLHGCFSHRVLLDLRLFYLIPFAMGVFYSFMDSTVDSHFVGLDNYRELLASGSFRKAASNTFYFSAVSVPLMLVLSLGLAMLLNKNIYFRKWLRTAYVLPLVVPVASIILSLADPVRLERLLECLAERLRIRTCGLDEDRCRPKCHHCRLFMEEHRL